MKSYQAHSQMRSADYYSFLRMTLSSKKLTCINIILMIAVRYSMARECQGWCCTFFAREKQLSLRLVVLFQTITHRCRVTGPDSTHQHMHVSDFLGTAENRINSVTKKRGPKHSSQVACCYHLF